MGLETSVVSRLDAWIGAVFYRGINPSGMGYADLRYWNQWHEKIADAELKAAKGT